MSLLFLVDDFSSESDLHMACIILQKQIEHIDGKKENIIIPSIKMKKIREEAQRKRDGMRKYLITKRFVCIFLNSRS